MNFIAEYNKRNPDNTFHNLSKLYITFTSPEYLETVFNSSFPVLRTLTFIINETQKDDSEDQ